MVVSANTYTGRSDILRDGSASHSRPAALTGANAMPSLTTDLRYSNVSSGMCATLDQMASACERLSARNITHAQLTIEKVSTTRMARHKAGNRDRKVFAASHLAAGVNR